MPYWSRSRPYLMGECFSSRSEPSRARSVNWRGSQDKDGGACANAPRRSRGQYHRLPASLRNIQDEIFKTIVDEVCERPGEVSYRGCSCVDVSLHAARIGGAGGSIAGQCVPDG